MIQSDPPKNNNNNNNTTGSRFFSVESKIISLILKLSQYVEFQPSPVVWLKVLANQSSIHRVTVNLEKENNAFKDLEHFLEVACLTR